MRKHLLLAGALSAMLFGVLPMAAASASTRVLVHVLTINKVGGPAVKVGQILGASVKTGTVVTFFKPGTTIGVKCTSASFREKVTANPVRPGTAKSSLTSLAFSGCKLQGIPGVSLKSIKVQNLPYATTISDSTGLPVHIFNAKTTINLSALGTTLTCVYTKSNITGKAVNTDSSRRFSNQTFTKSSGPTACLAKGNFSAQFAPVRDLSVGTTTHPRVFVS